MCAHTCFLCHLLCQIRRVACDQLYTLSQSDTSGFPEVQKPNLFLLSVILTAQLPLWSPTSVMRGVNQRYLSQERQDIHHLHFHWGLLLMVLSLPRLLSQCTEYFDLRCQLLDDLTSKPIHFSSITSISSWIWRCKNCYIQKLKVTVFLSLTLSSLPLFSFYLTCCSIRDGGVKSERSHHAGGWDLLAGQLWAQLELWDGNQRGRQRPPGWTPPPHQDLALSLWQWEGTSWWAQMNTHIPNAFISLYIENTNIWWQCANVCFPGPSLIQQLLDDFLFRASRIIINSSNPTPSPAPSHDFHPKYVMTL